MFSEISRVLRPGGRALVGRQGTKAQLFVYVRR